MSQSSQASDKSDPQQCSSAPNSSAAKDANLGTHKVLAGRRGLSCSFVFLKGSKIFLGILNAVSTTKSNEVNNEHSLP